MVTKLNIKDLIKKCVDDNVLIFDRHADDAGVITGRLLHMMEEYTGAKIKLLYFLNKNDIKFAQDHKFDTYPCFTYNEKAPYKYGLILAIMNDGQSILGTY